MHSASIYLSCLALFAAWTAFCQADTKPDFEKCREVSDWSKRFIIERVEADGIPLKELISTLNYNIETHGGKFGHLRLSCSEAAGEKKITLNLIKIPLYEINSTFIPNLTKNWMGYTPNGFVFFDQTQSEDYRNSLVFDTDFKAHDEEKRKQAYNERLASSTRTWKSPVPLKVFPNILPSFEASIEEIHKIQDLPPLSAPQIRVIRWCHKPSYVDIDLKKGEKTTYGWPEEPRKEAISHSDLEWLLSTLKNKEYQNLRIENQGAVATSPIPPPNYIVESKMDGQHLIKIRHGVPRPVAENSLLRILAIADPKDKYIQKRIKD